MIGLKRRVGDLPYHEEFLTQSPAVRKLLEMAESVASSEATLLITGESGTGKTLLARLIHASSERRGGPFTTLDCASFQESLLESELFGHKRGAFTGAVSDKPGKVELADGGTLFLDEIAEVPLHLQGKLLRLVEDRVYERLGDPTPRTVDARIIAATNRDLDEMVAEKAFREDSVLSAQRRRFRDSSAAKPSGGRPAARARVPFDVRPHARPTRGDLGRGRGARARALLVAGERPRAEPRHRASRPALHRSRPAPRASAGADDGRGHAGRERSRARRVTGGARGAAD